MFISPSDRVTEQPEQIIDLLNASPALTVDAKRLKEALSFAFAGGDTTGAIRGALDNAKTEPSDLEPSCFVDSLFVPDLIDTCMKVRIGDFVPQVNKAFLSKLLTRPPKDLLVTKFRRAVLEELVLHPKLKTEFKETYRALYRLRDLFESEIKIYELDNKQRRIEILNALRDVVLRMEAGFKDCASALCRMSKFAAFHKKTEGFERLRDLLDFDNHLAGVELKLRIGGDGRVNRFEIVSMRENKENRFHRSPLSRLLLRIKALFSGYIFSEGELVNRWVDTVFEGIEPMLPPLIQLLGEMEFYLSALAFKDLSESKGLAVGFPECEEPTPGRPPPIEIEGLFNPLLFGQGIVPIPCDLKSDRWETITVVTGPNSGGKTRLLQAAAILQLTAECGMFAPIRRARIRRATGLFVSLIEEAGADNREGRLGTELVRIRSVFERSKPDALVILDELCSGTNPLEGEEIFRLVVSLLSELKPRVFITTHFLQFAAALEAEKQKDVPLRFLQVQLDPHDCPTYQFVPGVATTSLAHLTAARLGVTREELTALVRRNSSPDDREKSSGFGETVTKKKVI